MSDKSQSNKTIDFFIIGAPKCGTTALNQYLSDHDDVFMGPKEMNYFLSDSPDIYPHFQNEENYFSTFADAQKGQLVGETSVFYFYSDQAINNILKYNPRAKIIVFVRNPMELLPSLHQQYVKTLYEDNVDFGKALRIGDDRDWHKSLEPIKKNKWLLDYQYMGQLGHRMTSIADLVPPEQLHLIFYDDLKASSENVYQSVLKFLGVDDDGRKTFGRVNVRGVYRSKFIAQFLKNPPNFLKKLWHMIKPALRFVGMGDLYSKAIVANQKKVEAAELPQEDKGYIHDMLSEDIKKLSKITERDLSHWL